MKFVFLEGDKATTCRRVANRPLHYLSASRVDSRLATLEPPTDQSDINMIAADASLTVALSLAVRGLELIEANAAHLKERS